MATTAVTPEAVQARVAEAISSFGDVAVEDVTREATFEALDIDSLDLAELAQIVEEEYGVRLESSDVKEFKTVGDAVDRIVARAG
ncbi:acyl carrier protein [Conexibacter sp. SYSU D00693]|uniref:acyl carrier protein n=1 Tax=Conexibacter sp. SYSU D00693 TaxID=2812560 RepID=UPI00196A6B44|nr:acyl carrier protein [Conexibacter sp. SYSU D00693]